jgi:demethylmenaquinone methyltransferase/2-methoxy-6-polyprenyl-1,4-benzoquinol methylase
LIAPIYDRVIRAKDLTALVSLSRLEGSERVLDAGGGTGRIALGLLGSAGQVVVADPSLAMLSHARSRNGLIPAACQAEALPFAHDAFDRIIMVDAFHHVEEQSVTLAEFWRVLRPGGLMVIEEPNIRRLAVKLVAMAERLALMRSRFRDPTWLADRLFSYGARTSIHEDGHTVWVVAEKSAA